MIRKATTLLAARAGHISGARVHHLWLPFIEL